MYLTHLKFWILWKILKENFRFYKICINLKVITIEWAEKNLFYDQMSMNTTETTLATTLKEYSEYDVPGSQEGAVAKLQFILQL